MDANQGEIVDALIKAGCTVVSLAAVGGGCPDLLVGRAGVNWLMEVKDGSLAPSRRRLTPDQVLWHGKWRGQKVVVKSVAEALAVIKAL